MAFRTFPGADINEDVDTTIFQQSHGFAVGDVLYYTGSTYAKAKADNVTTAEVVGIVSEVTTNSFNLTSHGKVSGLSSLTAGGVYFLSASTAGALTATEPTTIGYVSKPLLIADSATSGYFFNYRGVVIGADGSGEPAGVSVYRNGTFTHNSSGSWLQIGMDTEVFDTHSYHDNTTNNSRLTVPTGLGGKYLIVGAAWWDTNTTGERYTRIYLNGTTELGMTAANAGNQLRQQAVWYGDLNTGDYVELGTYHNSGASRTVGDATNDAALFIQMFRIGGAPTPGVGQTDGWTLDDASTWTYATSTTFTVAGDQTVKFSKGTRIKLTQTTVKYFVVVGASFSSGTTTVTIAGGSDYSLANAAITNPYYSYAANPQGYPGWFSYTPTLKAVTSDPTLGSGSSVGGSYSVNGNTVSVRVSFVFGSSGAAAGSGEYYVAAPVGTISVISWRFVGSGFFFQGGTGRVGVCDLDASTERCYFWVDSQTTRVSNSNPAAWSNNHQLHADFSYENN